jgi:TonB family protein
MEKAQKDEPIFQVVEEMPKFPGGLQEAMVFIGKNIKYPVAAQKARIEGRVIVQFVVGKDGSVSDIHTVRGVSPELDAEAIRVVSMMPKWIPGKQRGKAVAVKYTMPIMFRLKTPEAPKKEEEAPALQIALKVESDSDAANVGLVNEPLRIRNAGLIVRGAEDKLPLVVVDGKVMGRGTDLMAQIDVSQIQSISVLKDDSAMAEYGEQAKDGAIIIITKNEKK